VRGNLAFKYRLAGRLAEATTLNEQLHESRRRVYGDAQPAFIAATTSATAMRLPGNWARRLPCTNARCAENALP
jgi:hypothetical protein